MKKTKLISRALSGLFAFTLLSGGVAFAANNSNFTQTINAGSLAADILDASRVSVGSPTVAMSAKNFSFDCQNAGNASTGTFGTNTERIYVTNPDAADNGWTLSIAGTGANTTRWANGGSTQFIDFNDPTTSGCADNSSGEADTTAGQMTVNASGGTLTADCGGTCTNTGVTLGSSNSFNQGTTDSITLINAAAGSSDVWRGYLENVAMSQTIPAQTPVDNYTLNLTLTTTAL